MILNNLHLMHDIISANLSSPDVAREKTGAAIAAALGQFQDGDHDPMELQHREMMSKKIGGVDRMRGAVPAVGKPCQAPALAG